MTRHDPDFDMRVDVETWRVGSLSPRCVSKSQHCRVTPKRIYTPGGATYDRETGKQIIAQRYLAWESYRSRALTETLRRL